MKSKRARILPGVVLALLFWTGSAAAQGANWWTDQYGTRAELLGGAVVGSFIDLSSTYYNPGAVVLSRNVEVLLSAKAFQAQSIKLSNPENPNVSHSTLHIGTAPTLFTGLIPSKWLTGQLAYSALTRQDLDFRLEGRYIGDADAIESLPGDEFYAIETYFDHELNENWYGATWSHSPRENLGVGATLYGAYRSQRVRSQYIAQAVSENTSDGATAVYVDQYSYWTFRFVAKLGVALDFSPLQLGLTVTTPSLAFLGSGDAYYNRNLTGFDLDGDDTPDSELAADDQEGLSATYKSPVSIAAGASYRWEGSAVHFSCEWFNGVDAYRTVELELTPDAPAAVQSLLARVTEEYDPVFNLGIGLERTWTESFQGYVSFITDFSAAATGEEKLDAPRGMNLYHLSAGAAAHIKALSLTLGLAYAFGGETFQTLIDPETANEGNYLLGNPAEAEVKYRRLKAIVGFAFTL
jgi:hypothetical protein